MATYVNDLRLKEIATGDESGTWGTSTNTNLELIAEAFSFGTEAITTNADTHTTTIADGSTDPGRSIYLKYTGTLDSACTITLGPNTVSKLWFIENGTSGSQNIIISQGSGANVTIPAGDVKAVYSDGAGSGAAIVDAFASLNVVDLKVEDDLTVTDDASVGGDLTVTGSIAGTLSTAAQPNITSLGTLTTLTVDEITINGDTITATDDFIIDVTDDITLDADGGDIFFKDGGTQKMHLDGSGRLLIGVDSGDGFNDDAMLRLQRTGDRIFQSFKVDADQTAAIFFGDVDDDIECGIQYQAANRALEFSTGNNSEAMRIDSSGAVGIGTTSPSSELHVKSSGTSSDTLTIENSTGNGSWRVKEGGSSNALFQGYNASNSETIRLDPTSDTFFNNGNVGIGTSSPSTIFTVLAADGVADNDFVATITNAEATDGRSFGLGINAGSNGSDFALNINTHDAGANLMRLKGSGDCHFPNASLFGIGTDSATNILELKKSSATAYDSSAKQDGGARLSIFNSNNTTSDTFADIHFQCHSTSPGEARIGMRLPSVGNSELFFITEGSATLAERMRIDSSGNLLVGKTSDSNTANGVTLRPDGNARFTTAGTGSALQLAFFRNASASEVGSISTTSSATSYNTSSDYRLKENVNYTWDATTRLKQLKPARFNFIADETNTLVDGFLAHEVSSVVPEAITGEKDGDRMQGIDQSKLVPLLVKTIQELEARITALES